MQRKFARLPARLITTIASFRPRKACPTTAPADPPFGNVAARRAAPAYATIRYIVPLAFVALAASLFGSGVIRSAHADTPVACDANALQTAISDANSNSPATLTLASSCTYDLSGLGGALVVTGNITIEGNGSTLTKATHHVFQVDSGATLDLSDMTLSGNSDSNEGGAILNNGTVSITDSTLSDNTAVAGGAISNNASMTISNSTLSGNSANADGGAVRNESTGTLTLTGSTLSDNSGYQGGAIFSRGTVTIAGSTFNANSAGWSAGALLNYGTMSLTDTTIESNTAPQAAGGILSDSATLTVTDSTFNSNSAGPNGGGGIYTCNGTTTLSGTTLEDNYATHGGAIYACDYVILSVSGSTFIANGAVNGGAIISTPATVTITSSTFSGNSASNRGSAILNQYSSGSLTVTSSVFAGSSDGGGAIVNANDGIVTLHRNAITGTVNTIYGVNNAGGTVDAQCNWWGSADGPGGVGPGTGDGVSANVTFEPWLLTDDLTGPCIVVIPVPNGTTVTPSTQFFNQEITLHSSGLTGTTEVLMNGVATDFTVVSDNELTAIVTPDAGEGPVELTVTTPSGQFVLPDAFTAKAPPPPEPGTNPAQDTIIPLPAPTPPACNITTLALSGQWTLVAWPGATMPVVQALAASSNGCTAAVSSEIAVIWSYDSSTQSWQAYFPGATAVGANDLTQLENGMGYFVGLLNPSGTVQWKVELPTS